MIVVTVPKEIAKPTILSRYMQCIVYFPVLCFVCVLLSIFLFDYIKIGKTALMCASSSGYSDIIPLLLARGASIDAVDNVSIFNYIFGSMMCC